MNTSYIEEYGMTEEEFNEIQEQMSKQKKKYAVIVNAAVVNEWTYEVLATSQEEAEKIIREGLNGGDRELPDPTHFEQGKEVDGELYVADSYEV
jgi:hypothetical protein